MSFDRKDTYDKVVDIVTKVLNSDKAGITGNSTFEQLGADSLDILEIVMKLEEVFGIEISDADAEKIKTIDDAVDKIQATRTK